MVSLEEVDGIYLGSYFIIIDQQNIHYLMRYALQRQSLYCFNILYQWIPISEYLFFFLGLSNFSALFLSLLTLESLFWGLSSSELSPSFWLFLVLFRMQWMLGTVHEVRLTLWKLLVATICLLNPAITSIFVKDMAWHGLQVSWVTI